MIAFATGSLGVWEYVSTNTFLQNSKAPRSESKGGKEAK